MSDLTAEVRDALAAATPGPWEQSRGFPAIVYGADHNDIYSRPREEIERNVHLIASAPSWLAALCDRLDAAEAKLAAAEAALSPGARAAITARAAELVRRIRAEANEAIAKSLDEGKIRISPLSLLDLAKR